MTKQISVSVPADDKRALVAGATMLLTLADKLPEIDLPDMSSESHRGKAPIEQQSYAEAAIEADPGIDIPPAVEQHGEGAMPPPAPIAPSVATVETDARGLPWDERIHAGTKTKMANGEWKKRRGVDTNTVVSVEAELRALMAIPTGASPDLDDAKVNDALATLAELTGSPTAPAAVPPAPPAAAVPPTPPPAPSATAPANFPQFLKAVSDLIAAGRITLPRITDDVLVPAGIASMTLVASRQDLIPQLWEKIEGIIING